MTDNTSHESNPSRKRRERMQRTIDELKQELAIVNAQLDREAGLSEAQLKCIERLGERVKTLEAENEALRDTIKLCSGSCRLPDER